MEKLLVNEDIILVVSTNNAELLAEAICGHWGIKNQLNSVLDVKFQEDDSRIRTSAFSRQLSAISF